MPDELRHVGVLGMQWGRRKAEGSSSSRPKASADHEVAQTLKNKKLKDMSNDEIKKVTSRMQLEKSYKDLTKKRPLTLDQEKARKLVKEQMWKVAAPLVSAAMTVGMQMLIAHLRKRGVNGSSWTPGVRIVQNLLPGPN